MIEFLDPGSGPIPETKVIIGLFCGGWYFLAASRQGKSRGLAAFLGVAGAILFLLLNEIVTEAIIRFFPHEFFRLIGEFSERLVVTGLMTLSGGMAIALSSFIGSEGSRREARGPRPRFSWGRALFAFGAIGFLILLQLPAMLARGSVTGKSGDPAFLILGVVGLIAFAIWQGFQGSQSADPESARDTVEPDRVAQGDTAPKNLRVASSAQPETVDSHRPSASGWPFSFFGTIVVGSLIYFFLRDLSDGTENPAVLIVSLCLAIGAIYLVARFMR